MNKIAVNPTQFITCRLCLEELGSYQILPSVRKQIEYCFDIKVKQFDGLSQLICPKCEEILSNYSKIKKKFIEKQNELKGKIYSTQGSHHGKLSGAQKPIDESQRNFESKNENPSKTNKKKLCIYSSSSDQENDKTLKKKRTDRGSHSSEEIDVAWPKSYTKHFVCRICSSHWSSIKQLKNHFRKHGALCKKYAHIFKKHCQVTLYKSDRKPNVTGSRNKVVYNREKIVKNVNAEYHIIYITKDYKGSVEDRQTNSENTVKVKSYFSSDSSDEDIVVKRKRKRRFYSRSSNETFVLDNKSDMSDNESRKSEMVKPTAACINLDDSSEAESEISAKPTHEKQLSDNDNGVRDADQDTIHEIITSCRNKFIKKHYQDTNPTKNPSDVANKLQHKIFSIGRKIINKRIGVNCIPLLRFMEHKNLDITWLSREIVNMPQESNYIRIMPRRKNIQEQLEDNETGWTDYISTQAQANISNSSEHYYSQLNECNGKDIPEGSYVGCSDTAVLYDANLGSLETKKLLNSNPVANPKQLPKKFVANDMKTLKIAPMLAKTPSQDDNNSDLCMPIITSTTSLASLSILDDNNDSSKRSEIDSTTDKQQSEAPRIKVKPVSELMSVETLNRMQNAKPMIPKSIITKGLPLAVQNVTTVPVIVSPQNMLHLQTNNVITNLIAPAPAWQSEFMILDTVELPNTRTNSPYLYLKKLLQTHNMILLDTNVELSNNFQSLIKFKVQYKQDIQNQPVMLCLSLFCSKNNFCLKVKDRNNEDLDITKISANWQWEVLKIFKGEVVSKLLSNAQTLGHEAYLFTNTFLCLLKSINIKQIS